MTLFRFASEDLGSIATAIRNSYLFLGILAMVQPFTRYQVRAEVQRMTAATPTIP